MSSNPHRRLAGIYLAQKQPLKAAPHLEALLPLELQDNRYAKRLARLYRGLQDWPTAIKHAQTAVQIDPYDPGAHALLAELHEKAGNAETAEKEKAMADLLEQRQKDAKEKADGQPQDPQ
jgi:tetratricopeptide (TPR) repeat protein